MRCSHLVLQRNIMKEFYLNAKSRREKCFIFKMWNLLIIITSVTQTEMNHDAADCVYDYREHYLTLDLLSESLELFLE